MIPLLLPVLAAASPLLAPQEVQVTVDGPLGGGKPGEILFVGRVLGTPPFELTFNGTPVPVEIQEEANIWEHIVSIPAGSFRANLVLRDGTGKEAAWVENYVFSREYRADFQPFWHFAGTVEEFVQSLGPRRTIVLRPGDYDLGRDGLAELSEFVTQKEGTGNLALSGLEGLKIYGAADGRTRVLTRRPGGTALTLERCDEVTLTAIEFVHLPPEGEEASGNGGGPLLIRNSNRILVQDCRLSGIGVGLRATKIEGLLFEHSVIEGCDAGIARVKNGRQVNFYDSLFRGNGGPEAFGFQLEGRNRGRTAFVRSRLLENELGPGNGLFHVASGEIPVEVDGCEVRGNRAGALRSGDARRVIQVRKTEVQQFP